MRKWHTIILGGWFWYWHLAAGIPLSLASATPSGSGYQAQPGPFAVGTVESLLLNDSLRGKNLEIRVQYPVCPQTDDASGKTTSAVPKQRPVIVFSHGAGGSKDGVLPLTRYWVTYGYITIQPTHEDSVKLRRRRGENYSLLDAVQTAWNDSKAWQDRARDISFVLDSLMEIEKQVNVIQGRIDRKHIGMAGHSFGAMTTIYLSGAKITLPGESKAKTFGDERIRAFLVLSPQGPGRMGFTEDSWSNLRRPIMLMTGSRDSGGRPVFSPQWRLIPFEKFPPGDKYALWIEGANHMTFGCDPQRAATGFRRFLGQATPEQIKLQERFIQYVKIASRAFWDAYLKEDDTAKSFLQGHTLEQAGNNGVELKIK